MEEMKRKITLTILRDLSKNSEKIWEKYPEFKDVLEIHQKWTRKYENELQEIVN